MSGFGVFEDEPYERVDSEDSLISDTDIFKSIKDGKTKSRQMIQRVIFVSAMSSALILIAAIFINYQALTHANEINDQVDKLINSKQISAEFINAGKVRSQSERPRKQDANHYNYVKGVN